jgi:prepilin-type N-terminal cleavage/methylation domain-containing protein
MMKKGFTLIELLIVMAITGILGMLSIASFNGYSKVRTLQSSANDLVVMLNLAKSSAQSQIKPSSCTNALNGYRAVFSAPASYALYVSCSGSVNPSNDTLVTSKILPANVTFTSSSSFFFPVRVGGVNAGTIVITIPGGRTKTISVTAQGIISTSP